MDDPKSMSIYRQHKLGLKVILGGREEREGAGDRGRREGRSGKGREYETEKQEKVGEVDLGRVRYLEKTHP